MSVLTAADFLKLIDLEPFKKLNNEAGVSVQRSIELEKLRLAVKEGHVNLRFFLKWLNASAGCRLQERWLNKFFADDLGEIPARFQQSPSKSTEEKLKEEVARLTAELRASQQQNQVIASIASEDNQKAIFAGIVERIEEESQAELKAFAEKAATRAKQKAIEMMIAIFPNWKPSD
ncbi:hypothetical protein [Citrobacter portucalensis]|uniref:hypothetical protein n=1 Tax=Citrobacter portucalensis TaxID=1639133 RepID=UPI00288BE933|nr:hypothetical protein [Citrobacter portucalensis]WNI85311.1 hypothetical protein RIK60_18805 [Citrobacter portucalensis]